jgi:hypothetical protein
VLEQSAAVLVPQGVDPLREGDEARVEAEHLRRSDEVARAAAGVGPDDGREQHRLQHVQVVRDGLAADARGPGQGGGLEQLAALSEQQLGEPQEARPALHAEQLGDVPCPEGLEPLHVEPGVSRPAQQGPRQAAEQQTSIEQEGVWGQLGRQHRLHPHVVFAVGEAVGEPASRGERGRAGSDHPHVREVVGGDLQDVGRVRQAMHLVQHDAQTAVAGPEPLRIFDLSPDGRELAVEDAVGADLTRQRGLPDAAHAREPYDRPSSQAGFKLLNPKITPHARSVGVRYDQTLTDFTLGRIVGERRRVVADGRRLGRAAGRLRGVVSSRPLRHGAAVVDRECRDSRGCMILTPLFRNPDQIDQSNAYKEILNLDPRRGGGALWFQCCRFGGSPSWVAAVEQCPPPMRSGTSVRAACSSRSSSSVSTRCTRRSRR